MTGKRHKGTSRALKMMHILFWVVVTWVCAYVKFHVPVYFMYFICYISRKSKKGVWLLMKCPTVLQCLINMTLLVKMVSDQIRSDQSLSSVWLFATPWIAARQASLSITNSQSSLRLTSIKSVMPSSHLILSGIRKKQIIWYAWLKDC